MKDRFKRQLENDVTLEIESLISRVTQDLKSGLEQTQNRLNEDVPESRDNEILRRIFYALPEDELLSMLSVVMNEMTENSLAMTYFATRYLKAVAGKTNIIYAAYQRKIIPENENYIDFLGIRKSLMKFKTNGSFLEITSDEDINEV